MKPFRFLSFGALVFALFLSGCDTFSGAGEKLGVREPPHTHVYSAEPRPTYDAARRAAEQMGYRFVRGGPAQGELEAISGIATNDTMGSARQIALTVKLTPAPGGGTELSLSLKEITEADSTLRAGQATSTTMRDTPQYEVYFRTVQQALDAPKKP